MPTETSAPQTIDDACRAAGLTLLQREVVVLYLEDGMQPPQIRLKLHMPRMCEVQELLGTGLAKLAALPGFHDPARAFPGHLLFCVEDRRTYDERPSGMRGVEPDRASQRFQGVRTMSADDARLRQDLPAAAKLFAQSLRVPVAA